MGVPFIQKYRIAQYVFSQRLRGKRRYPLVLMLEPLFRCNLACAGCGKIRYPEEVLDRRLSTGECLAAADECGAPVISIAGGETLIHREMPQVVAGLVERRKFVFLCTNGLLLKTHLQDYRPSSYLTFSLHLDGHRERHDAFQGRARFSERAGDRRPFSPRSGREPDRSRLRILRGHANTRHPIS